MAKVVKYTEIKSTDECRYDGVSLGEVMLRLTPRDVPTARVRDAIRVSQGGGETNVACGLSYTFGLRSAVLTALVDDPTGAVFAVIDGAADEPKLSAFKLGTDQFPDRSTTVIVQVAGLQGGAAITLAGPGIPGSRTIAPRGLRSGFTDELRENGALYPLGVDVLLTHGERLIGLPRSTQIEEAR